jgi:biotin transport system substrate-specific component
MKTLENCPNQSVWMEHFQWFRSKVKASSLIQILGASLLIGLCAQIKIPLPFTLVPITGQTLGVLLAGGLLGRYKGALAVIVYLIEGSLGLPVWAGGACGALRLIGPVGGYYFAYIVQAYLAGWFVEKQHPFSFLKTAMLLFLAGLVQLILGIAWFAFFVGINNVLIMGFLPFLPGCAIKTIVATA